MYVQMGSSGRLMVWARNVERRRRRGSAGRIGSCRRARRGWAWYQWTWTRRGRRSGLRRRRPWSRCRRACARAGRRGSGWGPRRSPRSGRRARRSCSRGRGRWQSGGCPRRPRWRGCYWRRCCGRWRMKNAFFGGVYRGWCRGWGHGWGRGIGFRRAGEGDWRREVAERGVHWGLGESRLQRKRGKLKKKTAERRRHLIFHFRLALIQQPRSVKVGPGCGPIGGSSSLIGRSAMTGELGRNSPGPLWSSTSIA